MNVLIEDESKKNKRLKIFYIGILAVCAIAIIAAVIIQIVKVNTSSGDVSKLPQLTEDQKSQHKEEFYSIFENKVNYLENNSYKINKIESNKEIVYLGYQNNDSKINDYELKVNIPYININNPIIEEFNTQIKDTFEKKAKSIINTQNNNAIYTVDYTAYIANNIMSLVVRSTLKEGTNAQRDIIQTYNYDLTNQKECVMQDLLELRGITKQQANQAIKTEIETVQKTIQGLEELGLSVYARDPKSDIYSINNVTEYFIGQDNAIYIIFAYGNENNTSEMDIVVM